MQNRPPNTRQPAPNPKADPFADARRLRTVLPNAEFARLLSGWTGDRPVRGKLLGIELVALRLNTGLSYPVESMHIYAHKGTTWHRIEHLPARIDGSWRYELQTGSREWAVDVLRSARGKRTERATVARIGGDSLRERYLRLPGNTQPGR